MSVAIPLGSADLDQAILDRILGAPMPGGKRLLGVEYERLVLHRVDRSSAPVEFVQSVFRGLLGALGGTPMEEPHPDTGEPVLKGVATDRFEFTSEPGGQLEVAVPPFADLEGVDGAIRAAIAALEEQLAGSDYQLVGLGHAPVTPVDEIGLLPRARYRIMDREMPARGPLTRNMMRATAGFQITYDVADADDAAGKLALLYRLSPLLMATCANSRMVAGVDSGYASYRHHVWLETDSDRSGVPIGCLDRETAVPAYVDYAKAASVLFVDRGGVVQRAPSEGSLVELVARGELHAADLDLHLSGLFPFVRLRNYIELRCLDSVEWAHARSVMALVSGLVYCTHAFAAAYEESEPFALRDAEQLRLLHESAARLGLDATAPDGRGFREIALRLLDIAGATLGGENCDWARPEDLLRIREVVSG